MTKKQAYEEGRDTGYAIGLDTHPLEVESAMTLDPTLADCTMREVFIGLVLEAEENARQYSPFEFFSRDINEAGDRADSLWDAYEHGVCVGAKHAAAEVLH